jgi:4-nitrophenyl phosphatase
VVVFDLDGVLYRGADPVPGAADALARLRARGARVFFLTNNSTQTRADFVAKLTGMGMPCAEDEVMTSAYATAVYLTRVQNAAGKSALVIGGDGLRTELTRAGLTVLHPDDWDPEDANAPAVDYVVVGLDRGFTYQRLHRAQQAVLRGAAFVATNRDGQFPVEGGRVTPGAGSVVAAIAAAADKEPLTIGKPETGGLEAILAASGAAPADALMVGDRLDTDIWCGNRLGVPSALVLTGITSAERARELVAARPEWAPTYTLNDLTELS